MTGVAWIASYAAMALVLAWVTVAVLMLYRAQFARGRSDQLDPHDPQAHALFPGALVPPDLIDDFTIGDQPVLLTFLSPDHPSVLDLVATNALVARQYDVGHRVLIAADGRVAPEFLDTLADVAGSTLEVRSRRDINDLVPILGPTSVLIVGARVRSAWRGWETPDAVIARIRVHLHAVPAVAQGGTHVAQGGRNG